MRANDVSPSTKTIYTLSPLSISELLPRFTLPLAFMWDLIPSMSRHCYRMEGIGAKQAGLKLS